MSSEPLPLLDLFSRLRDAGLPLGIGEYQVALKALQGGFGLEDRDALRRLCQTLWTKTDEEKRLLDYHFDQLMPVESETNTTPQPSLAASPRRFSLRLALIGGALLLASTGVVIAAVHFNRQTVTPSEQPQPGTPGEEPVPGIPDPLQPDQTPQPEGDPQEQPDSAFISTLPQWVQWILIGVIAIPAGGLLSWWISRWLRNRQAATTPKLLPNKFSQATQAIKDEIEAAQAQQRAMQHQRSRFTAVGNYLPITQRQMKRSWRYLSCPVREGSPTELDVEATIHQIGRQGIMVEPVLVPPRVNRAALLLLLDCDGSMVPFQKLTERLIATAQRGGRFGSTRVYYFHNCIESYLYRDEIRFEAEPLEEVLASLPLRQLSTLIVSDAGAARQGYNPYRVEQTEAVLSQIYQQVRHVAWLNPMPQERWANTTAAHIAKRVPMFECSRAGLDGAIEVLRGRKSRAELEL